MITVKVRGVDAVVRSFDRTCERIEEALTKGTEDAGDHIIDCITEKFGRYQSGWPHLKPDTIRKKGFDEPLIETSDMMFSFDKKTAAKTRKHVVWVTSDDPKLVHHMYGAPAANVPKRDPVRPTIKEENDAALEIIKDAVRSIL